MLYPSHSITIALPQCKSNSVPSKKNAISPSPHWIILSNFFYEHAKSDFAKLQPIETWNGLLGYIFGVDIEDTSRGAKKIENINIKELLLMSQLKGPLVEEISPDTMDYYPTP